MQAESRVEKQRYIVQSNFKKKWWNRELNITLARFIPKETQFYVESQEKKRKTWKFGQNLLELQM